tara:strand:+ start:10672 stop:11322 length:651 start_codon:yes stop_codon:yes gene_type:complete
MKVVAIIPIKQKSERVKDKNFRKINGKPLYEYYLSKLKKCNFDSVYIDTDSEKIKKFAKKLNYNIIDRLPYLSKNNANGNDLLNYHARIINADLYFQLFITSPLLREKTINMAISKLKNTKVYDSIFTVQKIYSWFWFSNKPVNYNPKILPRSQDAKPIVKETTGLYGIKKNALLKYKCRIGKTPYLLEVDEKQAIDLDNDFDFDLVELLIKRKYK